MAAASHKPRAVPMSKQKVWSECIDKENYLRLKWFSKNEARMNEIANQRSLRTVSEEVKEDMRLGMIARFQNVERHPLRKLEDAPPYEFDQTKILNVMKPVDPDVTNLIYTSKQKDGRQKYLHARIKTIPENRFYFPECSSFEYGWGMWDASKRIPKLGFARREIIREFYRRGGVKRDPDWHKEPAKISPTVCGSI